MKKLILFILIIFVVFLVWIFLFPKTTSDIFSNFWLQNFNQKILDSKEKVSSFFGEFDLIKKFQETKDKTLEIKQNVEWQIENTKEKIETIQTNVDNTTKAINESVDSINKTVDSLNDLQKSVWDITDFSASGSVNVNN